MRCTDAMVTRTTCAPVVTKIVRAIVVLAQDRGSAHPAKAPVIGVPAGASGLPPPDFRYARPRVGESASALAIIKPEVRQNAFLVYQLSYIGSIGHHFCRAASGVSIGNRRFCAD